MMPPECCLCDEDALAEGGGLVRFAMRPEDEAWRAHMKASGGVGHPPWQQWFCPAHHAAAAALSDHTVSEAMHVLRDLGRTQP